MKTVGGQCIKNKRSEIAPLPGSPPAQREQDNQLYNHMHSYCQAAMKIYKDYKSPTVPVRRNCTLLLQHCSGDMYR